MNLNDTHDEARRSWVASANDPDADFPLQNLPYGMFATVDGGIPAVGVAIGDHVLDLGAVQRAGLLAGDAADAAALGAGEGLAALMALPPDTLSGLRRAIFDLLCEGTESSARARPWAQKFLHPMQGVRMHLPCPIRGYTDFLASEYHTARNGRLKGLANPVPENYRWVPVAYHGRASSIVVSGTPIRRPNGQWKTAAGEMTFGPADALDFELEMGVFVGRGNPQGVPVKMRDAHAHIFGLCLLNDWSSKAVQWWEQMLGPFLGKNFGTTISPWIVTQEALEPFRAEAGEHAASLATQLPYLRMEEGATADFWNIGLSAALATRAMRERQQAPAILARTHLRYLCWTPAQMLVHHTSNGCNLETGDLLGTGTISGPDNDTRACMTEITSAGREPLTLPNSETRPWLADGDEVVFRARAEAPGFKSIGFGECRGVIEPAISY